MKNVSLIVIALNVLFVSGCSWFGIEDEDAIFQPAPLPEITKQFSVKPNWSSQVGDGVGDYYNKLSPVSYDGKVIAADINGLVAAFDIVTGKVIWKTEVSSELFGGVAAGSGIIAVGSAEAEVIVLDAKTGTEKWRNLVSSEIISAPAIGDGKVVVRTIDGKLFALNAKTGERDWIYDRTVPALTIRGTSSISLERGVAATGFANGKVGLFAMSNGRPLWEQRVANSSGSSELDRMIDADATPIIFGDFLYAVTFNGNLAAFNLKDGSVAWQRELSSYQNMSIDGQSISVTDSRSNVKSLDRRTGGTLWTQSSLVDRRLT
ncbi:MAG: outer membrane protein assembly factor BamB, partial [Enterobacterales bacterium]